MAQAGDCHNTNALLEKYSSEKKRISQVCEQLKMNEFFAKDFIIIEFIMLISLIEAPEPSSVQ